MYENEKSKVLIVLSAICSAAIMTMSFFCVKYFFTMELNEDNINTNTFLLFSDRNNQIISNVLEADSFGSAIKYFFKLLLVGLSGTLAWVINYAFSELPINIPKKDNLINLDLVIGKKVVYGIIQLIPGIVMGIYLGLSCILHTRELLNQKNFNLFFKNYNVFMVISQIIYIIACLFLLFLIFESVISSGIMGSIIRIPLMLVSNFSLMLAILIMVYVAIYSVFIILGIIIGLKIVSVCLGPKVYIRYM